MNLTDHERFGRALRAIAPVLRPYVDSRLTAAFPDGQWWDGIRAERVRRNGHAPAMNPDDPQVLLRMIASEWRRMRPSPDRATTRYAEELVEARNEWAHTLQLSTATADRALQTMRLLLEKVEADPAVQLEIDELLAAVPTEDDADEHDEPSEAQPAEEVALRPVAQPAERAVQLPAGIAEVILVSGDIEVAVQYRSNLNFAQVHNGVRTVLAVNVQNHGPEAYELGELVLRIQGWEDAEQVRPLHIDLDSVGADSKVTVDEGRLGWHLSPKLFAGLDEAAAAQLHVEAPALGVEADGPLRLLAADEWNALLFPESLAAFVRPRSEAISDLLGDVSNLLAERTGDGAVDGYQRGVKRAAQVVEAIYDAMQARRIRYIEPPASFERTGQKIRSHKEVLVERWGTCLDLAVTFAAALEAAGIRSVLVMTKGHAFAGFLLSQDLHLSSPSVSDANTIDNIAGMGEFGAVELTLLTERDVPVAFTAAQRAVEPWWSERLPEVRWMLDVTAARHRVRPLPVIRQSSESGVVEIEVEVHATHSELRARRGVETLKESENPPRIDAWCRSLLDLTRNNPLLNITPRRTAGVGAHVPKSTLGRLEDLLVAGKAFRLAPHDDLAELHLLQGAKVAQEVDAVTMGKLLLHEQTLYVTCASREFEGRLIKLQRRARTEYEESGANALFLTIGSVVFSEERSTRAGATSVPTETAAPLFLLPVRLEGKRGGPFRIVGDDVDGALPNQTLIEKLHVDFDLVVPELEQPDNDESGIDVMAAVHAVRSALLAKNLGSRIRVEEDAHLGLFKFASMEMWRDLSQNWQKLIERPVVRHLVDTPTASFDDGIDEPQPSVDDEATMYLPIPADGSQMDAVRWAAAGKSFVLQGPPGTGKSQTITNLVAHCLAEGKTVLFVAEKQAALDVVRRRLDEVGLGVFSLDLHGKSQTNTAVREQLRAALNVRTAGSPSFSTLRKSYRDVVTNLAKYPDQLHQEGPFGWSAWTARREILQLLSDESLWQRTYKAFPAIPRSVLSGGDLEAILDTCGRLSNAAGDVSPRGVRPAESPWSLAGVCHLDANDRDHVAGLVEALFSALDEVTGPVRDILEAATSTEAVQALTDWLLTVAEGGGRTSAEARATVSPAWRKRAEEAHEATVRHREAQAETLTHFRPEAVESDVDGLLARAVEADGKVFGKKKRRRAIVQEIAPALVDAADAFDLTVLTARLTALRTTRDECRRLDTYLQGLPGLTLPYGWNSLADDAATTVGQQLTSIVAAAGLSTEFDEVMRPQRLDKLTAAALTEASPTVVTEAVFRMTEAWCELLRRLAAEPSTVATWRGDRTLVQKLGDVRDQWSTDRESGWNGLMRWSAFTAAEAEARTIGLDALVSAVRTGSVHPADVASVARVSLAQTTLDERVRATGLDVFDREVRDRHTTQFIKHGADIRDELRRELPAKIVGARTFDGQRPRGTVAEFLNQLNRKRGAMSVRSLLRNYGSVITEVTPCVMMSPASVARFLEPSSVDFDVIVFDEASQIRVADAIGAMGRGQAVVVVGDNKQMPPTSSFMGGSSDSDDDDGSSVGLSAESTRSAVVRDDAASILEFIGDYTLPSKELTWHYRSRDEALVAFSNHKYYESRLSTFPNPPQDGDGTALELRRVNGEWESGRARVNRAEADEVIYEIVRLLHEDPASSVGVVTFNTTQRDLIEDTLATLNDAMVNAALSRDDEPLFVKNLENVQGDERDVILFTLAFSKNNATGKLSRNWGPVSRRGGEKRLNVAITRAKERVVLFSSFEPEELVDVDGMGGLPDLKEYLIQARDGAKAAGLDDRLREELHAEDVASALRERGLETTLSVGLSDFRVDIAVRWQDRPWIAVMLDGEHWARRGTVGDRDGLPTEVLVGSKGWSVVERVWLPEWLERRDQVIDRVLDAAKSATVRPPAPRPEPPVTYDVRSTARVEEPSRMPAGGGHEPAAMAAESHPLFKRAAAVSEHDEPSGVHAGAATFKAASEAPTGTQWAMEHLEYSDNAKTVLAEMEAVLEVEGPIMADRLARIVIRRFGFAQARQARMDEVLKLLGRGRIRTSPNGDRVVWPRSVDAATYTAFRVPGDKRTIDAIPYEELRNAMVAITRVSHGIEADDLITQTGREFGVLRIGKDVRARLVKVLNKAVGAGNLEHRGERIFVPSGSAPQSASAAGTSQRDARAEGWYEDPNGMAKYRYWDGSAWTSRIRTS